MGSSVQVLFGVRGPEPLNLEARKASGISSPEFRVSGCSSLRFRGRFILS